MTSLPTTDHLATRASPPSSTSAVLAPAGEISGRTPITGGSLGPAGSTADVDAAVERATAAFQQWRVMPAPVRGELVRRLGELLRQHKDDLGELVSLEAGKIRSEGQGEVQEMIDICDFAVGLSRQLYGLTIASERPGHRLMEQWHPLGPCGVITAFNFPVAVWAWNAALALVCGDPVVWKPSDKTPLTAVACDALLRARGRRCRRAGRPQSGASIGGATSAPRSPPHDGVAARVGHRLDARWAGRWRRPSPSRFGRRCSSSAATTR